MQIIDFKISSTLFQIEMLTCLYTKMMINENLQYHKSILILCNSSPLQIDMIRKKKLHLIYSYHKESTTHFYH